LATGASQPFHPLLQLPIANRGAAKAPAFGLMKILGANFAKSGFFNHVQYTYFHG